MKRVLVISKDGKNRAVEELTEELWRELRGHPMWKWHPKPKNHEGDYEFLAQLKTDKELEKERLKAEKALRKRVYGR